jgi:ribosomal subunit interface protein
MELQVRGRNLYLTDSLRDYVERQVRYSLDPLGSRVLSAFVMLVDSAGPREEGSRSCQIVVRLRSAGNVLVEESGVDVHAATDAACERVGRAVARKLERTRDRRTAMFRSPRPAL